MSTFSALLPTGILVAGLLAVLFADILARGRRPFALVPISCVALAAAAVAALVPLARGMGAPNTVLAALKMDSFALVLSAFCSITGLVTVLASLVGDGNRRPGAEFHALILGAVAGMAILSAATDLVTLYLAFETVSIAGYVLVGMRRGDRLANEASLKYVLFGAVSSGLMLYGLSWIYGLAGGTSLEAIRAAVQNGAASQPVFTAAAILVFAGFAFKISAVPFHFWAPDVYQGAPAAVAGFLAVASKAAGFAALIRFAGAAGASVSIPGGERAVLGFLPAGSPFVVLFAIAAIVTMTFGNVAACRQTDLKRLLAWSSIAHAGYMLLALAVWSRGGMEAIVFYLVAYLFMNLAAFLLAGIVVRATGTSDLAALRGLGFRHPWLALAFAVSMLSLTGIPPLFGFIGKYVLFYAVLDQGFLWLAVIGLVNGAISLYYYAKPLFRMYLEDPSTEAAQPVTTNALGAVLATVLVVPVVGLFLYWSPIWDWVKTLVPSGVGVS